MFAKISVAGADKHPLYVFLTEKATNPEFFGEIRWNFDKFLIDKTGRIIACIDPREKHEDEKMVSTMEDLSNKTKWFLSQICG